MKIAISIIITVTIICIAQWAAAENYVGIILDGYQENCKVKSKGEEFNCAESKHLFAGNEVIKKPDIKALKIKWTPYANGKELDKTTLIVVFEPPKSKKGVVQNISEFLGFVKTEHRVSVAATRGGLSEYGMPQPGDNSTIISGQKTTFICVGERGRYIVFKDSKGIEIYRKETKGEYTVQLTPEDIGMKSSGIYYWNFIGANMSKPLKIRLLGEEVASQVVSDIEKIGNEKISEPEKKIKQAAYLQFISDTYPEEIDLYWLSYQILEGLKEDVSLKEDDRIFRERLKKNYLRHLSNTI